MANGNLGAYLRAQYGPDVMPSDEKEWEDILQKLDEDKDEFSAENWALIEKRIAAFKQKAGRGEWLDAAMEHILVYITAWATAWVFGVVNPEQRAEELREEAYSFGRRILDEVRKEIVTIRDEERIMKAIALDVMASFMWGIADGPLSVNSSLLANMSAPEYVQRCVKEVIKYLQETAAQ